MPIDRTGRLPDLEAMESSTLEFKGELTLEQIEIAKDVAALANAQGGTLLVGAYGGSRLEHYKPLAPADAKASNERINEAVKVRCTPAPLYSIEHIEKDGGFVLAVNVHPFPGQIVGVHLTQTDRKGFAGRLDGLYAFPIRIGTHTKYLTPEQLPMFIDARIRRIATALDGAEGHRAVLFDISRGGNHTRTANITRVEAFAAAVHLSVNYENSILCTVLPFDLIQAVAKDDRTWNIYIRGQFELVVGNDDAPPELRGKRLLFKEH